MMSEIWNFSPSLKDQVQLCISSAGRDQSNKWFKEFGHLTRKENLDEIFNQEKVAEPPILVEKDIIEDKADIEVTKKREISELDVVYVEEIVDSIDTDFLGRVDFVIEECVKNSTLLQNLAQKLSVNTVEKLCKHICDIIDINEAFLTKYFELFMPTYIKRMYNSATLDILVNSYKKFPVQYKLLLETLIKDEDMPKQVLQDFVQSLDDNERSNFIMDISDFDLTSQQFSNNVFTVYTAYKDCKKSERIQIYVQSLLTPHSAFCLSDRHFGRLLLTFLQTQKSLKIPINNSNIKNIIETHRSPFKRPCVMLLKELMGEDDQNKSISDDDSD